MFPTHRTNSSALEVKGPGNSRGAKPWESLPAQELVEPSRLAGLVLTLGKVGRVPGGLGLEASCDLEVAVPLVEVRGDRVAPWDVFGGVSVGPSHDRSRDLQRGIGASQFAPLPAPPSSSRAESTVGPSTPSTSGQGVVLGRLAAGAPAGGQRRG